jgi:WD40 repeat protein
LSFAHRNNVVHRDIKPSNILLDEDGNAYLTDFGIAKELIKIDEESLTGTDMIVGSPDYLSPEQARTQPISPQTDIFCLGIVLYEILTSKHPFIDDTPIDRISKLLSKPLPEIEAQDPQAAEAINEVIHKATAKEPDQRYSDVLDFARAFREAAALSPAAEISDRLVAPATIPSTRITPHIEPKNPYKGLRAFQAADERDFFGREQLTEKLLMQITGAGDYARFLAIVGPSGSGKSSLVRAGLIPKIRRGEITGSEKWYVADMIPSAHPLDELEVALIQIASRSVENLREQLERDERGLVRATQILLPDDDSQLMLVVDQFEEIFTLVEDEDQRAHFMDLLFHAVTDDRSRLRVVITLRADYYDRPLQYPEFGELVRSRMETILPMSSRELEQAITRPVERIGITYEEGLVPKIIEEVHAQPGALPLLQYALTMLFEARQDHTLTHTGYQQVGGAVGALAKRAEEIYSELDDDKRETAQRLFMRLVSLDEETKYTRRRTTRSELLGVAQDAAVLDKVIDTFATQRLFSLDHDPATRTPTVELAHEAILHEWARLRRWLEDARDDIRIQRQLTALTADWLKADRDPSFTLRGSRLETFETWSADKDLLLTPDEQSYLRASIAVREEEMAEELARKEHEARLERRSRNFLRGLVGVFAIATVISIVFLTIARNAQESAEMEADSRATQQVIAQDEAYARATQQSLAETESMRASNEARQSFARELAASALDVLDLDPQLSVLLALQAVETTYNMDRSVLQEAENALHHAVKGTANRLLMAFPSSDPYLWKVAFSPDGNLLATYGTQTHMVGEKSTYGFPKVFGEKRWQTDGQTRVWNLQNGELLVTLPGILAADNWLDEDRIPTIHDLDGNSFKFTIWNAQTGEPLSTIEFIPKFTHTDDISLQDYEFTDVDIDSVKMSPDGRYLSVSFSPTNNTLHIVWDIETGQEVFHYERTGSFVSELVAVSFLSESELIATGTYLGTLNTWNFKNGEFIYSNTELSLSQAIIDIAHHPTDQLFASASALFSPAGAASDKYQFISTVTVWNVGTGQEHLSLIPLFDDIWSVAFNEDGTRLATGSQDGIVTIWNAFTGQEIHSFTNTEQAITDVAFGSNDSFLATTSWDGVLSIWDIRPDFGFELFNIGQDIGNTTTDAFSISLSPDGRSLFAMDSHGGCHVWDAETGVLKSHSESQMEFVKQVTHSPSGETIGTINQDGLFTLWDGQTGEEKVSISGFYGCCFAFHPRGDFVAITASERSVKVFNLDDLIESGSSDYAEQVHFAKIYDNVLDIMYNVDGSVLTVLGENGYLKSFHVESGEGQRIHLPSSSSFASQHNDSLLAMAHNDGSVGLYNANSGELILELPGHPTFVNEVLFTHDDEKLISASRDGTIKIWDVSSGEELQTLFVHSLGVTDVALSPDGKRLYAAAADGTIRVYLLDIEELIALAYTRLTRWFTPEECQTYLHTDTCPLPP